MHVWKAQVDKAKGYALLRYVVTALVDDNGKARPDVLCGDVEVTKHGVTYTLTLGDRPAYGKVGTVAEAVQRVERMLMPTDEEAMKWALADQGEAVERRIFA